MITVEIAEAVALFVLSIALGWLVVYVISRRRRGGKKGG